MAIRPDAVVLNPLEQLTLEQLRTRTSMKWTAYPADVLPLWVAEMDVLLAPAVADAVHQAIAVGDTGYPSGHAYTDALAGFAADRWGWDGIAVERTAIVPDVMMGIVETLRLITDPGDTVVSLSSCLCKLIYFLGGSWWVSGVGESVGCLVRTAALMASKSS